LAIMECLPQPFIGGKQHINGLELTGNNICALVVALLGGLGILNLEIQNKCLLSKWLNMAIIKDLFMSKGTFQVKDGSQTAKILFSSFGSMVSTSDEELAWVTYWCRFWAQVNKIFITFGLNHSRTHNFLLDDIGQSIEIIYVLSFPGRCGSQTKSKAHGIINMTTIFYKK
ncbi:hypothetical protein ACJX0J_035461, partial [Zea mays]